MGVRFKTSLEHDEVVLASAKTYEPYKSRGYFVSVNLTGHPCRSVGPNAFPDVVVWQPGGDYGRTKVIEEIETAETVNLKESAEWKRYAKLKTNFILVVPRDCLDKARNIISQRRIRVFDIHGYYYDENGEIKFCSRLPVEAD